MALLDAQKQSAAPKTAEAGMPSERLPPAGPHARPDLTNYDACPGAGALPSEREMGGESDPGAG